MKRIRVFIYTRILATSTDGDGGWTDACRRCGRVRDKEGATSSRPGRMKTTGSLSPARTDTAAFTCHAVSVGGHDIRLVQFSPLIICPRLVDRLSTTTASLRAILDRNRSRVLRGQHTYFVTIPRSVCALMRATTWIFSLFQRVLNLRQ